MAAYATIATGSCCDSSNGCDQLTHVGALQRVVLSGPLYCVPKAAPACQSSCR